MNITAGKYKGQKVDTPNEKITRPTLSKTRMGVFNMLYSIFGDFTDKSFLDVFGGSGIMGLEALSRGFVEVKVFEQNKKAAEIIKKNYNSLGLIPDLLIGDSLKLIKTVSKIYDVVYVDPPYQSGLYDKVIPLINAKVIVIESLENIDISEYRLIKQKKYGTNTITFITKEEL